MAVGYPQHPAGLPVLPLQALNALALRTLAIATGEVLIAHLAALLTGDPASTQGRGAAYPDGADQLDGALIRPVYLYILLAVVAKKLPYSMSVR